MAFDDVIGQRRAKEMLRRALKRGRVPHAYLFYGEEGVGKEAMAVELAKALICQTPGPDPCDACPDCKRVAGLRHPDLSYIFPAPLNLGEKEHQSVLKSVAQDPYRRARLWANPSISIERIRELRKASSYKSLEGKGRAVIITEAEKMTPEASNALLKILEEPPGKMKLILTSSKIDSLLPTIVSRCQRVRFDPLRYEDIEEALIGRRAVESRRAKLVARLSMGSFTRALELLEEDLGAKRKRALDILLESLKEDLDRLLLVEDILDKGDKRLVKDHLNLILLWFRDAMILREWSDRDFNEELVNFDQLDQLKMFLKSYGQMDFEKAIFEVERSIDLMDRNVYVNLILIVLFNNLRNLKENI